VPTNMRYSTRIREATNGVPFRIADLERVLEEIRAERFLREHSTFYTVDPPWQNQEALAAYFAKLQAEVKVEENKDHDRKQRSGLQGA
jgi:hypothetical protein